MAVLRKSKEILEADYPGVQTHIILWPTRSKDYPDDFRGIVEGCRRLRIPVHRVENILPGYDVELPPWQLTAYVVDTDGHPNAHANRILADYVVHTILEPDSRAVDSERPTGSQRVSHPTRDGSDSAQTRGG